MAFHSMPLPNSAGVFLTSFRTVLSLLDINIRRAPALCDHWIGYMQGRKAPNTLQRIYLASIYVMEP